MSDELVTLTLAHSPDSDDLVMWWPLTGMRGPDGVAVDGPLGRPVIDTGRFRFETVARDVEELNKLVVGEGDSPSVVASLDTSPAGAGEDGGEDAGEGRALRVRPRTRRAMPVMSWRALM